MTSDDPHPFVEAWFRFNYLRMGTSMDDLIECWRNCPHDDPAIRTLHVHAIHGRSGEKKTAARIAISILLGEEQ